MASNNRLLALDILRGITIAGMILVNNPGSWGTIYAPLRHAQWNGLTPTDLVFPFFMFIMGISTCLSLRKYRDRRAAAVWKILRRSVIIFAIGWGLAWLGGLFWGRHESLWETFTGVRTLGVLQRLAISYLGGALIGLVAHRRALGWIIALFLGIYAVILITGRGWEMSTQNIIARVDMAVLGPEHMYTDWTPDGPIKFDPEGLLGILPSIAHVLIGFWAGLKIIENRDNQRRMTTLFILGALLTFSGLLLDYGMPINKKIWSPTFVLTTCGLASTLLALLIWAIDVKGWKRWCRGFEAFGVNPLALYVFSSILAVASGAISWTTSTGSRQSLASWVYDDCLCSWLGAGELASLIYALLFVGVCWLVGLPLYLKRIYIKI
ncbi:MAG: DUF5009 domain-containing protein [Bacteroidales bacterium]|nr:DUF5009 domain-containing protein [Bacteroidales bacterium]